MKYYYRFITKREKINKFGKIGYRRYQEVVYTNDISKYNKGNRIKFKQMEFIGQIIGNIGIIGKEPDTIFTFLAE